MPKSPTTFMRPYFGNAFEIGLYPTHMYRWAKEEALHSHIKKIILVSFQSFFFLFLRGWANGIGLLQYIYIYIFEGHPFN